MSFYFDELNVTKLNVLSTNIESSISMEEGLSLLNKSTNNFLKLNTKSDLDKNLTINLPSELGTKNQALCITSVSENEANLGFITKPLSNIYLNELEIGNDNSNLTTSGNITIYPQYSNLDILMNLNGSINYKFNSINHILINNDKIEINETNLNMNTGNLYMNYSNIILNNGNLITNNGNLNVSNTINVKDGLKLINSSNNKFLKLNNHPDLNSNLILNMPDRLGIENQVLAISSISQNEATLDFITVVVDNKLNDLLEGTNDSNLTTTGNITIYPQNSNLDILLDLNGNINYKFNSTNNILINKDNFNINNSNLTINNGNINLINSDLNVSTNINAEEGLKLINSSNNKFLKLNNHPDLNSNIILNMPTSIGTEEQVLGITSLSQNEANLGFITVSTNNSTKLNDISVGNDNSNLTTTGNITIYPKSSNLDIQLDNFGFFKINMAENSKLILNNSYLDILSPVYINGNFRANNTFTLSSKSVIISSSDTYSLDFSKNSDFILTFNNSNYQINLANKNVNYSGQQGSIIIKTPNPNTGCSLTWELSNGWCFSGGLAPTLSSGSDIIDIFSYIVVETGVNKKIVVMDATNFTEY
jgi:hypothetical protein